MTGKKHDSAKLIRWNLLAIIGWANVILGVIALVPVLFGVEVFFIWGGVFGLVIGGVLVTNAGPIRTVDEQELEE